LEDLDVKVIDVGVGLERIPWLINGSATSYLEVFKGSYEFLSEKLQIKIDDDIWKKLGPYSC
jgi:alanyl-tRNA synthetase